MFWVLLISLAEGLDFDFISFTPNIIVFVIV